MNYQRYTYIFVFAFELKVIFTAHDACTIFRVTHVKEHCSANTIQEVLYINHTLISQATLTLLVANKNFLTIPLNLLWFNSQTGRMK